MFFSSCSDSFYCYAILTLYKFPRQVKCSFCICQADIGILLFKGFYLKAYDRTIFFTDESDLHQKPQIIGQFFYIIFTVREAKPRALIPVLGIPDS